MGKYASIYDASNPKDPEILVNGYGRLRLSQLKKQAEQKAQAFADLVKKGNYNMSAWLTYEKNEVLILFVRALKEVEEDLEALYNTKK